MRGKFQSLSFTARESGGGLAEAEIAEADFIQDAELGDDFGNASKKGQRLAGGEFENFVYIFAAIADIEDAGFEACATAFFANQLDISEELHFYRDGAVALASFAAAAGDVEGKMAGGEAAPLGIGRGGKDFADGVEGFEISGRIRTRSAADGRLVNDDHFADVGVAFEAVAKFLDTAARALCGERAVENVVHQRGLAGAADAGYHGERAERDHQVDVLKIVESCTVQAEKFSC